jgi:hypothetical protein
VTEPTSVPLTVTTHVTRDAVTHILELAQGRIVVDVDRGITGPHRDEMATLLYHLGEVMDSIWAAEPRDGEAFVVDLRRRIDP